MAYLNINRARYEFLLIFGTDEYEIRRFFSENQKLLILNGAKVQNLPRGRKARIAAMLSLPSSTDTIVQKWFSTNLTMINPEPAEEFQDCQENNS